MFSLDQLVSFFDDTRRMKTEGRARFDIDQECRWSYFMVDVDREKLIRAGRFLENRGFGLVGFLEPDAEDKKKIIYLRLDRLEKHTPLSLYARNAELYKVARDHELEDYDGMDVGAVDGP